MHLYSALLIGSLLVATSSSNIWVVAFTVLPSTVRHVSRYSNQNLPRSALRMSIVDFPGAMESLLGSTSIHQAVETFDGSTIADPVVVSSVFWRSLSTKIISVIIGQVLASIVFGVLAYVLSSQLSKFGDYVSTKVFQQEESNKNRNVQEFRERERERERAATPSQNRNLELTPTIPPDFSKLFFCLIIDILGTSSELLPVIGELTDLAYAPAAALALRSLFQGSNVVFALEFLEEILPFTDILPLATICWVVETYFGDSDIARTLQIGVYGAGFTVPDVIDDKGTSSQGSSRFQDSKGVIDATAIRVVNDDDLPRLGDRRNNDIA